jgi:hypothetical protein
MPTDERSLVLHLRQATVGGWYTTWLTVGEDYGFEVSLNPGFPFSIISPAALREIEARQRVLGAEFAQRSGRLVHLQSLKLESQQIPPLEMRVHLLAEKLGPGCVLGFDFFKLFEEARMTYSPAGEIVLTLVFPKGSG